MPKLPGSQPLLMTISRSNAAPRYAPALRAMRSKGSYSRNGTECACAARCSSDEIVGNRRVLVRRLAVHCWNVLCAVSPTIWSGLGVRLRCLRQTPVGSDLQIVSALTGPWERAVRSHSLVVAAAVGLLSNEDGPGVPAELPWPTLDGGKLNIAITCPMGS
jgi:hypothetical protein